MSYKFKMGDRVKGLGMTGTIAQVNYGGDSLIIQWDKKYNYYSNTFVYSDGRLSAYGEPCIELISIPKPVVKETKRFYMAYFYYRYDNSIISQTSWYASKETLMKSISSDKVVKIVYKDFLITSKG